MTSSVQSQSCGDQLWSERHPKPREKPNFSRRGSAKESAIADQCLFSSLPVRPATAGAQEFIPFQVLVS